MREKERERERKRERVHFCEIYFDRDCRWLHLWIPSEGGKSRMREKKKRNKNNDRRE